MTPDPRDVHVLPIGDLKEHVETRECWCGPMLTREAHRVDVQAIAAVAWRCIRQCDTYTALPPVMCPACQQEAQRIADSPAVVVTHHSADGRELVEEHGVN